MIHFMMPVQYLQDAGRRRMEPQRRLMAAVLQTVLDDLRGSAYRTAAGYPVPTDLRTVVQARAYVSSTDRTWPFSFENVCEAIGLDAEDIRLELQRTAPANDGEATRPASHAGRARCSAGMQRATGRQRA